MSKIDFDKFLVAFYKELESIEESIVTVGIKNALEALGYMIAGNNIVNTNPDVSETDFGKTTEFAEALRLILYEAGASRYPSKAAFQSDVRELLTIAHKDFEKELELAFKSADEVQYQKGFDDGFEKCRKISLDALCDNVDVDEMVDFFTPAASDSMLTVYRQGIKDTLKRIKGE